MSYTLAPIQAQDDAAIAHIIKSIGAEFGAVGEGFGPGDAEVMNMSQHYTVDTKSLYLIATIDNKVVGGGGLAALTQGSDIAELRKLFLLPETRGLGIGKALTEQCLDFAQQQGYQKCYLDTLNSMKAAIKLYEKQGFKHLKQPLEGTVHGGCDVWMIKELL